MRVDETAVLGGPCLTAFITVPGTSWHSASTSRSASEHHSRSVSCCEDEAGTGETSGHPSRICTADGEQTSMSAVKVLEQRLCVSPFESTSLL